MLAGHDAAGPDQGIGINITGLVREALRLVGQRAPDDEAA
jgi:hypothetical protein